jgi:hypothetical protein
MADAFSDRNSRVALSHMAQAWLGLAERSEFIAPVATECAQPVGSNSRFSPSKVSVARRGWPNTNPQCPSHKFQVGESVSLIPSISRNVSGARPRNDIVSTLERAICACYVPRRLQSA